MRIALCLALLLATAGCGDSSARTDAGVEDVGIHPPDLWDPGPAPGNPCGYGSGSGGDPGCGAGYGGHCAPPVVSCDTFSCAHGTCLRSDAGSDFCICDPGYAGLLCDQCAPGYQPQGLTCVADDPCATGPCVYGTCYAQGAGFYCECQQGYAGSPGASRSAKRRFAWG
jgi:hypothetical protein